jgi:hypothetical protein
MTQEHHQQHSTNIFHNLKDIEENDPNFDRKLDAGTAGFRPYVLGVKSKA